MLMEGLGTTSPLNDYAYNGKELNEDFGLNLSDYGARWYDAALGRWLAVDPMAEGRLEWTGYNYTRNNPINLIDPNGMKDALPNNIARTGPMNEGTISDWTPTPYQFGSALEQLRGMSAIDRNYGGDWPRLFESRRDRSNRLWDQNVVQPLAAEARQLQERGEDFSDVVSKTNALAVQLFEKYHNKRWFNHYSRHLGGLNGKNEKTKYHVIDHPTISVFNIYTYTLISPNNAPLEGASILRPGISSTLSFLPSKNPEYNDISQFNLYMDTQPYPDNVTLSYNNASTSTGFVTGIQPLISTSFRQVANGLTVMVTPQPGPLAASSTYTIQGTLIIFSPTISNYGGISSPK